MKEEIDRRKSAKTSLNECEGGTSYEPIGTEQTERSIQEPDSTDSEEEIPLMEQWKEWKMEEQTEEPRTVEDHSSAVDQLPQDDQGPGEDEIEEEDESEDPTEDDDSNDPDWQPHADSEHPSHWN